MKTIWKYPLGTWATGRAELQVPKNGVVRHVVGLMWGEAKGERVKIPFIWIEVDSTKPTELRKFQAVGTGHEVPPLAKFVGTIIDEPFVWHIYEVP